MTYGLAVYRGNGALAFTSDLPAYHFSFITTAGTFTCGGEAPPLVFSNVISTGSGNPLGLRAPRITGGPNAWSVEVASLSTQFRFDALVADGTFTVESLVFTTEPLSASGYGIQLGLNNTFDMRDGQDTRLPLIVTATAVLDINGNASAQSSVPASKQVVIPAPQKKWYGLISDGIAIKMDTFGDVANLSNSALGYAWPNGSYGLGFQKHFGIVDGVYIRSLGSYAGDYDSVTVPPVIVLLVDSHHYT